MARETKVSMTDGPLLKVVVQVAVPIVMSNLLTASYQIVNGLWVGQLGMQAIAAVAASGPMFYVLVSLGSGLATAGAVLTPEDCVPCVSAIMISSFRDSAADDEGEHEGKHGKPFHDRCRCDRDTEDLRLALAGVDRGSTAFPLQDAEKEQGHPDQHPDAEQAGGSRRHHAAIEREHDHDAIDDDRGRQHRGR